MWWFIAGFWFSALLYEAGFVYLFGGTPGKLMTGIRVVSPKNGGNIGLVRSLVRAVGVMLSQLFAVLWLISAAMIFVAPQRRTLHDYLAGSVVSFEIE